MHSSPLTKHESRADSRKERAASAAAQLVVALPALVLLACAARADRAWLDRHILPSFLLSRDVYVAWQTIVRVLLAGVGILLIVFVRPVVARFVRRAPGRAATLVCAVVLALVVSEPALRRVHWRPVGWLNPAEEPRRQEDPRLGWTLVPSRTGQATVAGRTVEYALDAASDRVRRVDEPVDPARPTLLFSGESVMFGEGLTWEESIPAQVSKLLGVQSANLAVHGYGSDQAFLKLQDDVARFRQPVAIVSLFMTTLFGRNLDQERPHLMPGMIWHPAVQRWRIESLARLLVPYRSDRRIAEGVTTTRQIFAATVALARNRGAAPLIVMPQFGPESEPERLLRERIFDGTDIPVVIVPIDPSWRLPWNRHPDARAAHAIAEAIAARLHGFLIVTGFTRSTKRARLSEQAPR